MQSSDQPTAVRFLLNLANKVGYTGDLRSVPTCFQWNSTVAFPPYYRTSTTPDLLKKSNNYEIYFKRPWKLP